tara:strand:- start:3069 stop:3236 length:168 start_codon:yes stop_codon:yes gene_type:complete
MMLPTTLQLFSSVFIIIILMKNQDKAEKNRASSVDFPQKTAAGKSELWRIPPFSF